MLSLQHKFHKPMTESIEIRNAGPLKYVHIDNIRQFTVLIGESGCGKSVLMKTLMLMRYIYKMLNIRSALKNSGLSSPFRLHMKSLLHDDLANYYGKGTAGEVTYTVNGAYIIRIAKGKLDTKLAESIWSPNLVFLKESWVSEMRSTIPMWLDKHGSLPEAGFYFKETAQDFDKAADAVHDLAMPHLHMSLKVSGAGKKRKIYMSPDDGSYAPLELRHVSSGMQTSAPVLTLVEYFANKFSFKDAIQRSIVSYLYDQNNLMFYRPDMELGDMPRVVHMHIEEPELSLFPDAQCAMIEQLLGTAQHPLSDRRMELMLATHSPYIVNYLNVLLRLPSDRNAALQPEQLAVYRLYGGKLQNLMAQTSDGKWIVDTTDMTEPMTNILKQYRNLNAR